MNLKQLAYNTYKANEEFFKEKNILPAQLVVMYKIYYTSLVGEVFNPEKTKYYLYQNELGVFKNGLVNWQRFLKNWRLKLRVSNLEKEEDPESIIRLYRDKVYFVVKDLIDIQFNYLESVQHYIEYDKLTYEEACEFYDVFGWVILTGNKILDLNRKNKQIAIERLEYFKNKKHESGELNEIAS